MNKFYVVYDLVTGEALFTGSCPERDLPQPTSTRGVLVTAVRHHLPNGLKVVNGEVVSPPINQH